MFLDITVLTTGRVDQLTDSFIPGPGFPWSSLYNTIPSQYLPTYPSGYQPVVPPPVQSWYWLLMNIAFYSVLTWYFDNGGFSRWIARLRSFDCLTTWEPTVIPDEFGRSQPLYFFLLPSYWGFKRQSRAVGADGDGHKEWMNKTLTASDTKSKGKDIPHPDNLPDDDDVLAEKQTALDPNSEAEMRILGLRKEYRSNPFYRTKKDKVAVDGLYLNFREGSLWVSFWKAGWYDPCAVYA